MTGTFALTTGMTEVIWLSLRRMSNKDEKKSSLMNYYNKEQRKQVRARRKAKQSRILYYSCLSMCCGIMHRVSRSAFGS